MNIKLNNSPETQVENRLPIQYIRNNVLNKNGSFDNDDVYWYAFAIYQLNQKQFSERDSWKFFAAIHGFKDHIWARQANFDPKNLKDELPSKVDQEIFWDQCQHGTWYFLPWHRGYLVALEAVLRQEIVAVGGPSTWSLPYWDFTEKTTLSEKAKKKLDAAKLPTPKETYTPEAFLLPEFDLTKVKSLGKYDNKAKLVDNPLYVKDRYNMYDLLQELCEKYNFKDFAALGDYVTEVGEKIIGKNGWLTYPLIKLALLAVSISSSDIEKIFKYVNVLFTHIKILSPESIKEKVDHVLQAPSFEDKGDVFGSFGGPKTGFCHGAGLLGGSMMGQVLSTHGLVENIPHDVGHIIAGGFGIFPKIIKPLLELFDVYNSEEEESRKAILIRQPLKKLVEVYQGIDSAEKLQNSEPGLLTQPDTAGLDPLFYLHHVNQDRLWDSWLSLHPEEKVEDLDWLNGPHFKENQFVMPITSGQIWHYTPNDVKDSGKIFIHGENYSYSYVQQGTTDAEGLVVPTHTLERKEKDGNVELIGASLESLKRDGISLTAEIPYYLNSSEGEYQYFLSIQGIAAGVGTGKDKGKGKVDKIKDEPGALFVEAQTSAKQGKTKLIPLFGLLNASDNSLPGQGFGFIKSIDVTDWFIENGEQNTNEKLNLTFTALNSCADINIAQVMLYRVKVKTSS